MERRNYGEPVHEDNDILGMFSVETYTHFKPGWGLVCIGTFVAAFMGLVGVVSLYYPDKPSVGRGFEGGLDRELGGEGTVHVSTCADLRESVIDTNDLKGTNGRRAGLTWYHRKRSADIGRYLYIFQWQFQDAIFSPT